MMRVISGTAKGRPIKHPEVKGTRPATELVRGAIFSMLDSMGANWERVLDLFSGSGSLGIEALSRGAGWVDFIECEPRCCAIIRQNLQQTELASRAKVHCTSVLKALSFLDKEYGVILVDPPYKDAAIGDFLVRLAESNVVGADTILTVTHSPRVPLSPRYGFLTMAKEHRHGDSCISIYRKEEAG
jgi:16S rRNA (guanine(966)-N(2))-methyltransferase RsmD